MEYAIIKTGGKQYKVTKGDIIDIDRLTHDKNEVLFSDVLLLVSDGVMKVGSPFLSGVQVKAAVVEDLKGEKIRVAKFKAKARYRRVSGFRSSLTRLEIKEIVSGTKVVRKDAPVKKVVKKLLKPKIKA